MTTRYIVTEVEVSEETEVLASSPEEAVQKVAGRGDWDLLAGEEIRVAFSVRLAEGDGEDEAILITTLRGPDPQPVATYDNDAICEVGDWVVLGHGPESWIGEVIAVQGRRTLEVRWGRNGQPSTTSPNLLTPFFDRESAERELLRRGGALEAQ